MPDPKDATTAVKEAPATKMESEDECCEPGCSPETCGPSAPKAETARELKAETDECCAPDRGPDTCGC